MRLRIRNVFLYALMALGGYGRGIAADFYVSPTGSADGDGSLSSPWDLQTALKQPRVVSPGDVLWLRGGVYRGTYTSALRGTADAPVVVRQCPGERVVIDGSLYPQPTNYSATTITVRGANTWYWGFEVMNSDPRRTTGSTSSNPPDSKGFGITVFGPNIKLINLVIHDNGGGIGAWGPATNAELYGNLLYYNGWDGPVRSDGHAIYSNNSVAQRIRDNILALNLAHGLHVYGSTVSRVDNISIEGNISFQNGALSKFGFTRNLLIGNELGGYVAQTPILQNNYTYYTPGTAQGENNFGYAAGCVGLVSTNNYLIGGLYALNMRRCQVTSMTGNVFYGDLAGFDASQYPGNQYYSSRPVGIAAFVRPNQYERGRGHIAVYNWDLARTVAVDLSGILNVGDSYEIRDAQNYLGQPVATGTYMGGSVLVPMNSTAVAPAIGNVPVTPVHTGMEFGAFVIMRVPPAKAATGGHSESGPCAAPRLARPGSQGGAQVK